MKLLIVSMGILITVAICIVALGSLLPETRTGGADQVVAAPVAAVVAIITDVERQAEWRSEVRSIELDGASWIETTTYGERIRFTWTDRSANRLALRFQSDRGYTGEWTAELTPAPEGTRIVVQELARISNPVGRLMARILFDPAAFSKRYLESLAKRLEGSA
ncbi:MAG: SRPBCC family protein [Rhizobiaceae bacterium]|nr:SRPBCC family protein [Rhizobiaceae bacterium]